MASVYRATQLSFNRPVAIKLLAPSLRSDESFVTRFRREAGVQATLQHPHIVPVFESGEVHGIPFIVMRLIDGPSLRDLIRTGDLTTVRSVELLTGVADALDCAHREGILHRDVKPHNVLVEGAQHAWLADFGLTRLVEDRGGLTSASGLVGTYDYLAPEVARGEPASPASDVYSLAVTTFQVLTGSLPFPAAHQPAALLAHAAAPRPRASEVEPELPRSVDEVLQRGMAPAPERRPQRASEFLDDVRAAVGLERTAPLRTRLQPAAGTRLPPEEVDSRAMTSAPGRQGGPRARRRASPSFGLWARLLGTSAIIVAAVLAIVLATSGAARNSGHGGRLETVGGVAHNWINYKLAMGPAGPLIPDHATIRIACRLHGFRVQDGNTWWYRIASKPWNGRYYVSADAFYNNGHRSGSLLRTPFVDPRVPLC